MSIYFFVYAGYMRQQSRHLPAFLLLELFVAPQHGGALLQQLNTRMPELNADSGALYRALTQMEKAGEVVSQWDTSIPGPARRIYSIAPAGVAKLRDWEKDIAQRYSMLGKFLQECRRLLGEPAAVEVSPKKRPRLERGRSVGKA